MNQPQMYAPTLTPTNKVILIACALIFFLSSLLELAIGFSFMPYLAVSWKGVAQGGIHQLLTFSLFDKGFFSVLFNGLILWFLGSELEANWGRKLYIKFLLACSLGASLFYTALGAIFSDSIIASLPMMGLGAITFGMMGAYAIIYSERYFTFMFLFPIKARYFCMILAGVQIYTAIFSPYAKTAFGHLAGMAVGIGFLYAKSFLARRGDQAVDREVRVKKSHLKLVKKEDDDKHPKYWQ
jgi:membrane associated rhomboid family serine protease